MINQNEINTTEKEEWAREMVEFSCSSNLDAIRSLYSKGNVVLDAKSNLWKEVTDINVKEHINIVKLRTSDQLMELLERHEKYFKQDTRSGK